MHPIYWSTPFATPGTCLLVPDALDAGECARVVERATRQGFEAMSADYPPSYRDNDRMVLTAPELASELFARLQAVLPSELVDDEGARHRLVGLNERFRFCRYTGGQSFRIHRDGAHAPRPDLRSRLTVQVYLDEAFRGGRTRFYRGRRGSELGAIAPRTGTAIVFDHDLWHDGEAVTDGTKHVMRTDVMYERIDEADRAPQARVLRGHEGYVFVVRALEDGSLVSGSRDRSIRTWTRDAGGTWRCTRVRRGHDASVLSLLSLGGVIVSGSRDRTVRRWSNQGDVVLRTLGGAVLSLERYGTDGVVCGTSDGRITILTGAGGVVRELIGHTGWVWSLARLSDDRLVSGSDDGSVRVWDVERGVCSYAASPGRGPCHAVTVLGSGEIAAAFADGHVVRYDEHLAPIGVHPSGAGELYAIHPTPDGGFATGGEEACARVHLGAAGAAWDAFEAVRCDGFVRSICAVPGTRDLAVAGYDGCIRLSQ